MPVYFTGSYSFISSIDTTYPEMKLDLLGLQILQVPYVKCHDPVCLFHSTIVV